MQNRMAASERAPSCDFLGRDTVSLIESPYLVVYEDVEARADGIA
jgi:hypothetical protein